MSDDTNPSDALRFDRLFELAIAGCALVDMDGRIVRANPSLQRMLGYSGEELRGMRFATYTYPDDVAGELERFRDIRSGLREQYNSAHRVVRRDGRVLRAQLTVSALAAPDRPREALLLMQDVTPDRNAHAERRELLRDLRECTKKVGAMHETARLLRDDRLGPGAVLQRVAALLPPAMRFPEIASARARYGERVVATHGFRESPWSVTAPFRTRDGATGSLEVVYAEDRATADDGPFLAEERRLIETIGEMTSAILDRRVSDLELERSTSQLKLAQAAAGMGMWEWDISTGRVTLSEELERIAGLAPGAFPGTLAFVAAMVHPEDRAAVERAARRAIADPARGDTFEVEFRITRPDGAQRWLATRGGVVQEDDRAVRMLGMAHDVTGLRQLEHAFRASQKMEALGRLAGGVAHDFNNLITAIRGYSELAMEDLADDDARRSDVQEIVAAADRAAALTRQLLAFSRGQVVEPCVIDPNDAVTRMRALLGRLLGADIELQVVLGPRVPHVRIDPGQFEQVLLNLAVNARDAMPDGGRLTIETTREDFGERVTWSRMDLPPGRYLLLVVSDTGTGMSEETRDRLFEPFFTTKPAGQGTGLGLSTVYGIVQQSRGAIWVYSEPGRGSTFKVYIPAVDADVEPSAEPAPHAAVAGGSERVMIVDDDQQVRVLAERALRARGYAVWTAPSGEDALDLATLIHQPIDLLLTDLVLSGMRGPELARHIGELHPGTKVLYMTGYTDRALDPHLLSRGERLLSKPFAISELLRTVREALDDAAAGPTLGRQIDVAFEAVTEILRGRDGVLGSLARAELPLRTASERAAHGGLTREQTLARVRLALSFVRAESEEEKAACRRLIDYAMESYQRACDQLTLR